MPDGSHSPDAPITIHVDGDIQALPFIEDLKRAGLRLVNEGGKTYLRRTAPDHIDREDASNIRKFLASVRPLRGVCFCDNDALHESRGFVEHLALSVEGNGEPPTIAQCVDMLNFLSDIEPLSKERCFGCGGASESAGFALILERIAKIVAAYHEKHGRTTATR